MAVLSVFFEEKGLGPLGVKLKYLAIHVVENSEIFSTLFHTISV
jgi:hypothetical protein